MKPLSLKLRSLLTEDALVSLLSEFKKNKISVLGDVGIDRYTSGIVERISPEAPVPILLVQDEFLKLGLASNVADNIIALGGTAFLVGVVGKDPDAKDFCNLISSKKITDKFIVVDPSRRTILKERIVAETQQLLRVDFETLNPVSLKIRAALKVNTLRSLKTANALIIEDYAKGMLSEDLIQSTLKAAKKRGLPVLIDPHVKTPVEWYRGATLLTPNRREAEALARFRILTMDDLRRAGKVIMERSQSESLMITLGKDGMAVFQKPGASPLLIPTFAQEVYDVSGAGDTVISVLALALAAGAKLDEAAFVANLAAGVEVSKRGTATVSTQEIMNTFQSTKAL